MSNSKIILAAKNKKGKIIKLSNIVYHTSDIDVALRALHIRYSHLPVVKNINYRERTWNGYSIFNGYEIFKRGTDPEFKLLNTIKEN